MNSSTPQKQSGMTLIELVIAIAITAVVGLISANLLQAMTANNQQIAEHNEKLAYLQRSLRIIQADLDHISLPIRSNKLPEGDDLVTARGSSEPGLLLEFTRFRSQPSQKPPYEKLERVRYQIIEDTLVRKTQPVGHPVNNSDWYSQTLFSNIRSAEFSFLFAEWLNEIPDASNSPLKAIQLAIDHEQWQELTLISLASGAKI